VVALLDDELCGVMMMFAPVMDGRAKRRVH